MHDADPEHRAVVPEAAEVEVRMLVLPGGVLVRMIVEQADAVEDPELPQQVDCPDADEHEPDEDLELVEERAQQDLAEHEEDHRDPGGREHVARGPAHAHQGRSTEVSAADEEVRDRDEMVRVVAVLEPQDEGEPQEEEEVHPETERPTGSGDKKVSRAGSAPPAHTRRPRAHPFLSITSNTFPSGSASVTKSDPSMAGLLRVAPRRRSRSTSRSGSEE